MSKGVVWLGTVVVLVVALFAAACGSTSAAGATLTVSTAGSTSTVSTAGSTSTASTAGSTSTVGPSSPTVTTATTATEATATTVVGVRTYQTQMKTWYDKYQNDAKFQASLEAISTIQSPLNATQEDLKVAQDFDNVVHAVVGDLKKIEPPSQLASAHADYLQAWQGMAKGADQMLQALKAGGASDVNEAFLTLQSSQEQITQTQSTLENALGFELFSSPET